MALSPGDPAPDVTLVDHEGLPWRLGGERPRPALVLFLRDLA